MRLLAISISNSCLQGVEHSNAVSCNLLITINHASSLDPPPSRENER